MSDVSVRVEHLSKRYRLGQPVHYKDLRESLSHAVRAPIRMWHRMRNYGALEAEAEQGSIWALRDISLEVKRGEVLGIIGPNGAGKSTLLKILSRITDPTEGCVEIYGRVGSLLEVGTGFHPELTGRENIYLNGAILGMKRFDIDRRFNEIVEFSGVEKFIDTPVKRYSSGMGVRLAFAVAAHLEPEILVVDEVLAVGDAEFRKKCLGKMEQIAATDRTVLLVSHNMSAIRNLCSRALLLSRGTIQYQGSADDVVRKYLEKVYSSGDDERVGLSARADRGGHGGVRVTDFRARASDSELDPPRSGCDADLIIGYASQRKHSTIEMLHVVITLVDPQGDSLFTCSTIYRDYKDIPPSGQIVCRIKYLPLIPGKYGVNVYVKDNWGHADLVDNAAKFNVIDGGDSGFRYFPPSRWGHVLVEHDWNWKSSS